jgi:hypothetical protein
MTFEATNEETGQFEFGRENRDSSALRSGDIAGRTATRANETRTQRFVVWGATVSFFCFVCLA